MADSRTARALLGSSYGGMEPSLENCHFAHDSLGFAVLLRFCDALVVLFIYFNALVRVLPGSRASGRSPEARA